MARVKNKKYYEIYNIDKVCTKRSKVSYLQVLEEYKALLQPIIALCSGL